MQRNFVTCQNRACAKPSAWHEHCAVREADSTFGLVVLRCANCRRASEFTRKPWFLARVLALLWSACVVHTLLNWRLYRARCLPKSARRGLAGVLISLPALLTTWLVIMPVVGMVMYHGMYAHLVVTFAAQDLYAINDTASYTVEGPYFSPHMFNESKLRESAMHYGVPVGRALSASEHAQYTKEIFTASIRSTWEARIANKGVLSKTSACTVYVITAHAAFVSTRLMLVAAWAVLTRTLLRTTRYGTRAPLFDTSSRLNARLCKHSELDAAPPEHDKHE
jgi:hypothetical protein